MRFRLFVSLVMLSTAGVAVGTPQAPDRIIYAGESYALFANPLEQYFAEYPDRHPSPEGGEIVGFSPEVDSEGRLLEEIVINTALLRRYIATFEIYEDTLLIRDFEVPHYRNVENIGLERTFVSEMDKVFPTTESRKMDWYSGILVLPLGELLHYVHLSYASIFESYILLRIENGRVIDKAKMTGEEFLKFKRRQFAVYQASDEYLRDFEELHDEGDDEEYTVNFIFDYGAFVEKVLLDFDEGKSP